MLIFPGAAGPDSSTQLLKDRILKSDEKNGTFLTLLLFQFMVFVQSAVIDFVQSAVIESVIKRFLKQESTDMSKYTTGFNGGEIFCAPVLIHNLSVIMYALL